MRPLFTFLALLLASAAACRTGRNYPDPQGPRYTDADSIPVATRANAERLRVVTFNIAFARKIDSAIALFSSDTALRDADIVLLQEMTAASTARIARALGMHFVYYPAIYHLRANQDFGNAVLSRWPVVDDAKLILPHPSRYAGTHRVATAATVRVGTSDIRVYSTHLGTPADIRSGARREQLRAIIADAERYQRVVIGGDMNESDVGVAARDAGYSWPTERGPSTTRFGRWDHVFVRGLATDSGATGTVMNQRDVSDHRPVWVVVRVR